MKKLFSLILILALICPVCALADDVDPVVGVWYADLEFEDAPSFDGSQDYVSAILLLFVKSDGEIGFFELDFNKGGHEEIGPDNFGKWEKTGNNTYKFSIMGVGEYPAYIKNGDLHAVILVKDCYYILHKMDRYNWYNDAYYIR